jgi:GWxTD domain-containing protein
MKKLLTVVLLLFLEAFVNAQEKKFDFDFDYAQFAYDTTSNYLELYYSFGQQSLSKNFQDSSTHLEGILEIQIRDSLTQEPVVNKDWKISYLAEDTLNMNQSLVGVVGFLLSSGTYECIVTGEDSTESSFAKTYKEYITVKPFKRNNISISDLQLASKILQNSPDVESIFYKNTYEVTPLPSSVFSERQPVLFYYLELYNLQSASHDLPLKLNALVYNSRGSIVYNKVRSITGSVDSRVEVGTVILNKFPTDTYALIIALMDSVRNYGVSSSKRFFVYNPSVQVSDSQYSGTATNVLATQFGIMSGEELDDIFQKSKYIATAEEIEQYENLTEVGGKREFINQFWSMRDLDPSTPKNEFYSQYFERVQRCNQMFSALGKEGWKTDRGRIYLKYGEPSEIERFPNQIDSRPYEIWHYNEIQGGVIFVFADLTNFSDYQLIHSTARGELRDDNWTRRIRTI